jgi:hypothetical protein
MTIIATFTLSCAAWMHFSGDAQLTRLQAFSLLCSLAAALHNDLWWVPRKRRRDAEATASAT